MTIKMSRAAAAVTWSYAAAFGLPAIPISAYLRAEGHLPTFLGLFLALIPPAGRKMSGSVGKLTRGGQILDRKVRNGRKFVGHELG